MCEPLKLLIEDGKANLVSHCFLMNSRLKVTVEPMSSEHKIWSSVWKIFFSASQKVEELKGKQ